MAVQSSSSATCSALRNPKKRASQKRKYKFENTNPFYFYYFFIVFIVANPFRQPSRTQSSGPATCQKRKEAHRTYPGRRCRSESRARDPAAGRGCAVLFRPRSSVSAPALVTPAPEAIGSIGRVACWGCGMQGDEMRTRAHGFLCVCGWGFTFGASPWGSSGVSRHLTMSSKRSHWSTLKSWSPGSSRTSTSKRRSIACVRGLPGHLPRHVLLDTNSSYADNRRRAAQRARRIAPPADMFVHTAPADPRPTVYLRSGLFLAWCDTDHPASVAGEAGSRHPARSAGR